MYVCTRASRSMWLYTHAPVTGHVCMEDVHAFPRVRALPARGQRGARRGLGQTPFPVPATQEGPQWLYVRDFDRLLRESQREVLRLQRQIALRNQQEPPPLPSRAPGPTAGVRAGAPAPGAPGEVSTAARAGVWVCVDGEGGGSAISP